jgi:phenylacetate-CoA ligase
LGAKRFCGVYGSAELGIVAYHPDLPDKPVYRFPRDILHLEVLDPDGDGFGRLVGTNLLRRRFPIIRYDTGDLARIVTEEPDTVTVELKGRGADSFHAGDDYYSVDAFAAVLTDWEEFQIHIQFDEITRRDTIRFLLVPPPPPLPDRAESARQIERVLEADPTLVQLEVVVVPPDALERKPGTSKTPAVVDRRGR